RSTLTTQVINGCRSCGHELDPAGRLVYYSCTKHTLPNDLDPNLLLLRDPKLSEYGEQTLRELAARLTDPDFRIYAERGLVHVLNRDMFLQGTDPFDLFEKMQEMQKRAFDPAHAFYLG